MLRQKSEQFHVQHLVCQYNAVVVVVVTIIFLFFYRFQREQYGNKTQIKFLLAIMNIIPALILLAIEACRCQDIKEVFEKINEHTESFNAKAADLTWESSIKPDNTKLVYESAILQRENIAWQHRTCEELERLQSRQWFNRTQIRQKYLLCRGPKYTYEEARSVLNKTLYGC